MKGFDSTPTCGVKVERVYDEASGLPGYFAKAALEMTSTWTKESRCAREIARHELDLILFQQARREVASRLLGLPVEEVTRRDLLWCSVRSGRPPLAHEARGPRWSRGALSPWREA